MKFLSIALFMIIFSNVSYAKCTPDQFNEEYKTFSIAQTEYLKEKKHLLDQQLEKIKVKKNLTNKQIFDYRLNLLQDSSTLKIKQKEPNINAMDLMALKQQGKCGKLMKYHKDFAKLADKQWELIFSKLTAELN